MPVVVATGVVTVVVGAVADAVVLDTGTPWSGTGDGGWRARRVGPRWVGEAGGPAMGG
ncbi:hypothetical protein GCM10010349_12560 [Streptomyces flavofungini]|nr:hypothetical protein GCM10010349_12560 [Streptomyces flavofungini]